MAISKKWQIHTICDREALYKIFKKKVKIIGSGRTDAGVNAWGQCANFYLNHKINDSYKFLSE